MVFFFKSINCKVLDSILGFAAGVIIAASFWSLLAPAIEMAESFNNIPSWTPATIGFLLGGVFLAQYCQVKLEKNGAERA